MHTILVNFACNAVTRVLVADDMMHVILLVITAVHIQEMVDVDNNDTAVPNSSTSTTNSSSNGGSNGSTQRQHHKMMYQTPQQQQEQQQQQQQQQPLQRHDAMVVDTIGTTTATASTTDAAHDSNTQQQQQHLAVPTAEHLRNKGTMLGIKALLNVILHANDRSATVISAWEALVCDAIATDLEAARYMAYHMTYISHIQYHLHCYAYSYTCTL
jgi:hypothetical protein